MRGDRMRSYDGLFDEFAAAMQFPWYFGYNGNAFDECIADLSWIDPGAGYALVINSPADMTKMPATGISHAKIMAPTVTAVFRRSAFTYVESFGLELF